MPSAHRAGSTLPMDHAPGSSTGHRPRHRHSRRHHQRGCPVRNDVTGCAGRCSTPLWPPPPPCHVLRPYPQRHPLFRRSLCPTSRRCPVCRAASAARASGDSLARRACCRAACFDRSSGDLFAAYFARARARRVSCSSGDHAAALFRYRACIAARSTSVLIASTSIRISVACIRHPRAAAETTGRTADLGPLPPAAHSPPPSVRRAPASQCRHRPWPAARPPGIGRAVDSACSAHQGVRTLSSRAAPRLSRSATPLSAPYQKANQIMPA